MIVHPLNLTVQADPNQTWTRLIHLEKRIGMSSTGRCSHGFEGRALASYCGTKACRIYGHYSALLDQGGNLKEESNRMSFYMKAIEQCCFTLLLLLWIYMTLNSLLQKIHEMQLLCSSLLQPQHMLAA